MKKNILIILALVSFLLPVPKVQAGELLDSELLEIDNYSAGEIIGNAVTKGNGDDISQIAIKDSLDISLEGTYMYSIAWEVLELVNAERTKEGLPALKMDSDLLDAAMERAIETQLYWDHTRPDKSDWYTISSKAYGENIAAGQTTAEYVMESWMNSAGHKANIMNPNYTTMGVGCFTQGGVKYWTQLFGYSAGYVAATKKTDVWTSETINVSTDYTSFTMNINSPYNIYTNKTEEYKGKMVMLNKGWDRVCTWLLPSSIIWSSSDTTRFTVDSNGFMTGKKVGTATLKGILKADTTVVKTVDIQVNDYYNIHVPEQVKAQSAGKNKVKLTWESSLNATHYLIYAKKNGVYAYCGMTTGANSTTFVDVKALDYDYNFYWIFPALEMYNGTFYVGTESSYVYAKGVTPAVSGLKASSKSNGVQLNWNASTDAEGYLIYGIRGGGSYGYIGMTTNGVTFTDTKAHNTIYNYYWVFPYHKNSTGKMITGGILGYTYGRPL